MFLSVVGSSLIVTTVQAKVQGEHVSDASQPHCCHDMSPGSEGSLLPLSLHQPVVAPPGFRNSVSASVAISFGHSSRLFFSFLHDPISSLDNESHEIIFYPSVLLPSTILCLGPIAATVALTSSTLNHVFCSSRIPPSMCL